MRQQKFIYGFGLILPWCLCAAPLLQPSIPGDRDRREPLRERREIRTRENQPTSPKNIYTPPPPTTGFAPEEKPARPQVDDSHEILLLIENQMAAVDAKDYKTAYHNYTTNAFKAATSFDEFKFFITGYPVFTKNKNAVFGNLDMRGDEAMIQGILTSTDGTAQNVDYYLNKEGGLWKVAGIQFVRQSNELPPQYEKAAQPYDFQSDIQ